MKGISILFSIGGHAAYSNLHGTLKEQLYVIKFTNRITWKQAVDEWEKRYKGEMASLKYEQRRRRDYDDDERFYFDDYY